MDKPTEEAQPITPFDNGRNTSESHPLDKEGAQAAFSKMHTHERNRSPTHDNGKGSHLPTAPEKGRWHR